MLLAIEHGLLEDQCFQRLPSEIRWFYVTLSIEVLSNGSQGQINTESVLKLSGLNRKDAGKAFKVLENIGLIQREEKKIHLPKAEKHFRKIKGKRNKTPDDRKDQVLEIFRHWQNIHGKHQSRLTDTRRKLIRERLLDGYNVQDLKDAIEGCKASPYHQGQNDQNQVYDDLQLICRNADKVEQFMGYRENAKRQQSVKRLERRRLLPANRNQRAETIANFRKQNHGNNGEIVLTFDVEGDNGR